jgi:hypothetical protein
MLASYVAAAGQTPPPNPNDTQILIVASTATVGETSSSIQIPVQRIGDLPVSSTIDYYTADGSASERSDYTAALGTLRFAPGETSKTITVFLNDDRYQEGDETFFVSLHNATGARLIGERSHQVVTITSDDAASGATPVRAATFDANFFVRQHYVDFLNREPDAAGLSFWKNQTTNCGNPDMQVCRDNVSAAFFLSGEFQETGYLVYRFYQAAFGRRVYNKVPLQLREFLLGTQEIGRGYVGNQPGSETILEQNKAAYASNFVTRADFLALYPTTMPAAKFIDALNANTNGALTAGERQSLIDRLGASQITREQALREVAEDSTFAQAESNRAFILMQYYGYLRRNPYDHPDQTGSFDGYDFWLAKLNQFGGDYIASQMVTAFITSGEYEGRFGQ